MREKGSTDSATEILWCEPGQHPWPRPRRRGRRPRICPDHVGGLPPATPDESLPDVVVASTEEGDSSFTRRLKSLLRTSILHELEANKSYRDGWEPYDLRALTLAAIDAVVDNMELDGGLTAAALTTRLASVASRMAPDRHDTEWSSVARTVLEHLLNEAEGRAARSLRYVELLPRESGDDARAVTRRADVKLLEEREEADGSIVLRATPEAINLLVGAIDIDVTSQQEADEILLDTQLRRGRVDAAGQLALRARYASIHFAERVRRYLEVARQDIGRLDLTGEVEGFLGEAYEHLDACIARERHIVAYAWRMLERPQRTDEEQLALSRLEDTVQECLARHIRLHQELMPVRRVMLDQQERQRIAAPPSLHLPAALAGELLEPVLGSARELAAVVVDGFFAAVVGPHPPPVVDLDVLIDALLQPRPTRQALDDVEEPELEPEPEPQPLFSDAARRRATGLFAAIGAEPVALHSLLAAAESGDDAEAVAELVVLDSLWAFAPEVADTDAELGRRAVDSVAGLRSLIAGALVHRRYGGDDLAVTRVAHEPAEVPADAT